MEAGSGVLIIGAGVAGSACAWHLRRRFGAALPIRMLEADAMPGGRVRRVRIADIEVEAGATLVHSSNRCLETFRTHLGLERIAPHGRDGRAAVVCIWDGRQELFRSGSSLMTMMALLRRYGFSPARTGTLVRRTVRAWEGVYSLLHSGAGFPGTRDLFQALQLTGACATPAYDYYAGAGIGERFVLEFIDGVSRINYGQSSDMNAFASQVSLAGAGLAGGELFSIADGNVRLCSGLLADAAVRPELETRAVAVGRSGEGGWRVADSRGGRHHADVLILACAAEDVQGLPELLQAPVHAERRWQTTHATFVCGNLRPGALPGLDLSGAPDTLLTPEDGRLLFTSLGRVGHARQFNAPVWKLFSRQPLDDALLEKLFVHRHDVVRIPWRAYPVLTPAGSWPAFRLDDSLYDLSAMETIVSTMETQALSGLNVANLVASRRPAA